MGRPSGSAHRDTLQVVFSMGRYAAPEGHEALLSRRQDALRAAVISIFKTLPPAGDEITAVRLPVDRHLREGVHYERLQIILALGRGVVRYPRGTHRLYLRRSATASTRRAGRVSHVQE